MSDYKFPDELDGDEDSNLEAESSKKDVEIEIEDDTPPADRGRKPMAEALDEVPEDELSKYDESVQARMRKFTRGYHDERRAKEEALRERQAAEDFAKQVYEENKRLHRQITEGTKVLVEQSKSSAEMELDVAKRRYKEAYENGDADALTDAQADISRAMMKLDRAENMRPLQDEENQVQQQQINTPPAQKLSERDQNWLEDNKWFGPDDEMTSTALGVHRKLLKENGASFIGTKEYYRKVDSTMRRRYPEYFGSDEDEAPPSKASIPDEDDYEPPRRAQKPANVVAPASRSTPPDRIKLKASQAAIAKKLGVPLELYAQKVAELRKGE
jgi:hypothetical protein